MKKEELKMKKEIPTGVDNTNRRTWDREVFLKKSEERQKKELELVDEDNKRKTSLPIPPSEGAFYCSKCECAIKDSSNYLDHINGKKHLRLLGMSLRPERSTLDQVKERLNNAKNKTNEVKTKEPYDFEKRMKDLKEAEEKKKQEWKQKQKDKKIKERDEKKQKELESELDPDILVFGLPTGFGSSKK